MTKRSVRSSGNIQITHAERVERLINMFEWSPEDEERLTDNIRNIIKDLMLMTPAESAFCESSIDVLLKDDVKVREILGAAGYSIEGDLPQMVTLALADAYMKGRNEYAIELQAKVMARETPK